MASEMLKFLQESPLPSDLGWTKDLDFLYHFEAERQMIVQELLSAAGVKSGKSIKILDFGFLHGLTQEFLHRALQNASITVCDLPSSPIFQDEKYLSVIKQRKYLRLLPLNLNDIQKLSEKFDVIILAEVIEHLDPTQTARALSNLKQAANPGCILIVTTPNAAGLYNCWMTLRQKDAVQVAPLPNKTFGFGHIHLWTLKLLRETAEYHGWKFQGARFYHGREAEKFEEIKEAWVGLAAQINIRLLKLLTTRNPQWRGFFVASFNIV
jgi:Methyltransferase domain